MTDDTKACRRVIIRLSVDEIRDVVDDAMRSVARHLEELLALGSRGHRIEVDVRIVPLSDDDQAQGHMCQIS